MTGHKEMAPFVSVSLMGLLIAILAETGLRMAIKETLKDKKPYGQKPHIEQMCGFFISLRDSDVASPHMGHLL